MTIKKHIFGLKNIKVLQLKDIFFEDDLTFASEAIQVSFFFWSFSSRILVKT